MKPWVNIIRENAICLGGHKDYVFACLCHMLYCIETSTRYNLAFFILKRMEKTRNKPKELLPYGMLLTRLFKHVVSVFPDFGVDVAEEIQEKHAKCLMLLTADVKCCCWYKIEEMAKYLILLVWLARKNELKAHGTLLMALPDKHQLKFNSHKDAKNLMEAIKKRFGGNTETKKEDINLKFLRSLPFEWRTHTLIWRNKTNLEEQSLDDLFNSLKIYEDEVKSSSSIDADDLEEMDLKWQMAMFTMRARRFLQRTRRNLRANGPTSMGFDMSKVECYNCHRKGYFARECRSPKDTRRNEEEPTNYSLMAFSSSSSSSDNEVDSCLKACTKAYAQLQSHYDKLTADFRKSQFDAILYQTGLESVEARLLVYQQNESVFEEDTKLIKLEVQLRDNALVSLRQNLEKVEQERDDLKLKYQSGNGYHAVPPPYTGTFTPPKPDLVFNNSPNVVETDHPAFNVKLSPPKTDQDLSHTIRPSAPIIEDWVSNSEDESETKIPPNVPSFVQSTEQVKSLRPFVQHVETSIPPKTTIPMPTSNGKCRNRKACFVGDHKHYAPITHPNPQRHIVLAAVLTQSKPILITAVRPVSTAVPKISVTRPRHANTVVTKTSSPTRRHINHSPSPKVSNAPLIVTAVKALMGNPQHALKDKGVIDSGCSSHMTGNMSYLSDFEELNSGYVAFGGLENQLSLKVKVIKSDNGTEFKNHDVNQFCGMKGIKRKFSVPRNPQQNGIAERKNKTLIEVAKTMLADLLLPISFWAEAVNTACYVHNRVLVTKPPNKTLYELLHGRTPSIGFMRPFGCPVTILNTLYSLGKFDGKVDEGFLVGFSVNSKAFRVFNIRTQIVQETLHVNFLENKPNVTGGAFSTVIVSSSWSDIVDREMRLGVFVEIYEEGFKIRSIDSSC
nr:retrovirus-related Pol polyprotein from transposon TNT 1-94 [Tanacetum cinerariifolium]